MSNASEENCQVQTDTRGVPRTAACPTWCVNHDDGDIGHQDEFIVHRGLQRETPTAIVELRQVEFVNTGERDAVFVRIDDEFIPPMKAASDAADLAAALMSVAADAGVRS